MATLPKIPIDFSLSAAFAFFLSIIYYFLDHFPKCYDKLVIPFLFAILITGIIIIMVVVTAGPKAERGVNYPTAQRIGRKLFVACSPFFLTFMACWWAARSAHCLAQEQAASCWPVISQNGVFLVSTVLTLVAFVIVAFQFAGE